MYDDATDPSLLGMDIIKCINRYPRNKERPNHLTLLCVFVIIAKSHIKLSVSGENCESILNPWGRATHICVNKLTIIGSDNGLSPDRRQDIIWTNTGILLIGPWVTNFSEIFIKIYTFSFKKMHLKMSSGKCRPFCLGLNVLTTART